MFDNDYLLVGKHASYLKFLAKKSTPNDAGNSGIFARYIDVYINAAVFGLLFYRTAKLDTLSNDRALITAADFAEEKENCIFIFRTVILLDKTLHLSSEEKINRAFISSPAQSDFELFNSYIRGGLEVLHELFNSEDDHLFKTYEVISRLYSSMPETCAS